MERCSCRGSKPAVVLGAERLGNQSSLVGIGGEWMSRVLLLEAVLKCSTWNISLQDPGKASMRPSVN